ncbi:MAG TPA: STAS domain-containing protein [Actinomycetes bacterium]
MVVSIASGCEIALEGSLDVRSVSDVRAALHAAIDAGTGDLVVDVSGVEVVDATGLGVLVGADRRAKLAGRRVVLRDAGPRLLRILRATRLHRVLTVEVGLPA